MTKQKFGNKTREQSSAASQLELGDLEVLPSSKLERSEPRNTTDLRFLRKQDLRDMGVEYCNVHLLRLEADGKFPKRVYLSPARVVWIKAEVEQYLSRCIAARG